MFARQLSMMALLLVATASGCSFEWGYDRADWLVTRQIDGWVDLDPEQERELRPALKKNLAWHRAKVLPIWADTVDELTERFGDGLSDEDIDWFWATAEREVLRLYDQVGPDVVRFLGSLSPEQIDRVESRLGEDTTKAAKKLEGDQDKRDKRRLRQSVENIEGWTGDLSDTQKKKLAALLEPMPDPATDRMKTRQARQAEFFAALRDGRSKSLLKTMRTWLLEPGFRPSDERRASVVAFVKGVDAMLTDEQRRDAMTKLADWSAIFRRLHANGG